MGFSMKETIHFWAAPILGTLYQKWPFVVDRPITNGDVHRYVSLPEGNTLLLSTSFWMIKVEVPLKFQSPVKISGSQVGLTVVLQQMGVP